MFYSCRGLSSITFEFVCWSTPLVRLSSSATKNKKRAADEKPAQSLRPEGCFKFNPSLFFVGVGWGDSGPVSLWLFWHLHNFSAFWKYKQTQNASRCCQLCSAPPQNTGQRVCVCVCMCVLDTASMDKRIAAACERLSCLLLCERTDWFYIRVGRDRRWRDQVGLSCHHPGCAKQKHTRARAHRCKRKETPQNAIKRRYGRE